MEKEILDYLDEDELFRLGFLKVGLEDVDEALLLGEFQEELEFDEDDEEPRVGDVGDAWAYWSPGDIE